MSFLEAILVGLDEARRHLGQTVLSLLGLVLGTGSIVTVLALFGGQSELTQEYVAEIGGVARLVVRHRELPEGATAHELASDHLTYRDADYLKERATLLSAVSPYWFGWRAYGHRSVQFTGPLIGATRDYATVYQVRPESGRFISDLDVRRRARVVVLGWKYADSLFGAPQLALHRTIELGGEPFTVVGVLEREEFYPAPWSGNSLEFRNERGYIPITTAFDQYTGGDDALNGPLLLEARSPAGVYSAQSQVGSLLRIRRGLEDFDIITGSGRRGPSSAQLFLLFDFIFLVVGAVSLIAGGVVIANILLASVAERVREFGTRMALGATGLQIFAQVVVQVLLIAGLGGLLGLALGSALTGTVAHFMSMPAVVTAPIAAVAIATSATVGFLAGVYPAYRAAQLSPVEALRYG